MAMSVAARVDALLGGSCFGSDLLHEAIVVDSVASFGGIEHAKAHQYSFASLVPLDKRL